MKKITALLTFFLLLFSMCVTALADGVSISTQVPDFHTVTVKAEEGQVIVDGQVCKNSVQIERQKEQAWWIVPDAGKVLSALYYNGEDVTAQVKAGVFTAPALVRDAMLEAVFTDAPDSSQEETFDISGTVIDKDGNPVPGATVDIGGQTGITDENGNFTVEDVPAGTHTVTVTDGDGNVTGIGEITITEPGSGSLTVATDENGNPVITPGSGTTSIGMTMTIGEDGIIAVGDIKDTTAPSSGPVGPGGGDTDTGTDAGKGSGTDAGSGTDVSTDTGAGTDTGAAADTGRPGITESGSVQTGDPGRPAVWFMCMIAAVACLAAMGIQRKRKGNGNIGK